MNMQPRKLARQLVMQALYSWLISNNQPANIKSWVVDYFSQEKFDQQYYNQLFDGVVNKVAELDQLLVPYCHRSLQSIDPIELSILRLSCYELVYYPKIPFKVIINEALELTKQFGATDGYKFVNGVLDKLASHIRDERIRVN